MALAKFSFSTNYASFVSWQVVAPPPPPPPFWIPCRLSPTFNVDSFKKLCWLYVQYVYIEAQGIFAGLTHPQTSTPTHRYFSYRQADGLAGFVLNSFVCPRIWLKVKGEKRKSALLFFQALQRHFCCCFSCFLFTFSNVQIEICKFAQNKCNFLCVSLALSTSLSLVVFVFYIFFARFGFIFYFFLGGFVQLALIYYNYFVL